MLRPPAVRRAEVQPRLRRRDIANIGLHAFDRFARGGVGKLHEDNAGHQRELRDPLDACERLAEQRDREERGEQRLDLVRDLEEQRVEVGERNVENIVLEDEAHGRDGDRQLFRPRQRDLDEGSTTKQMTALKNSCSVTTKETLYCDAAACACCFREYRMTRTKPAFCTSIKVSATHFLVAADIAPADGWNLSVVASTFQPQRASSARIATAKPTGRLANLRSVWQLKQEPAGWKRSALSGRAVGGGERLDRAER